MAVQRIVPNLMARDPAQLAAFYRRVLDLARLMGHGFIATLAGEAAQVPLSLASEGGSGTSVPAISVEVDDQDKVLARLSVEAIAPDYGPLQGPSGVRWFYFRDPEGNLVNVLHHG